MAHAVKDIVKGRPVVDGYLVEVCILFIVDPGKRFELGQLHNMVDLSILTYQTDLPKA